MNYAMTAGGVIIPQSSPIHRFIDRCHVNINPEDLWKKILKPMLVGMIVNEGELLLGRFFFARTLIDRDADLLIDLYTNVTVTDATALGALTRPTGTGTGAKTLTDASWNWAANPGVYAAQIWTAGSNWGGLAVQGYEIHTQAAGGTPRLVVLEDDANGPYTMTTDDEYTVTPSITIKDTHGGEDN